jgi:DNA-binding PadR family transcriptional regulator
MAKNDLQGSLDLLVLKTLAQMGDMHGYGIVLHIQRASEDLLRKRVRSIRRCTAWSKAAGSRPSGR